jgi:ribosomal protein S18 acetylase RimI-like enzyme
VVVASEVVEDVAGGSGVLHWGDVTRDPLDNALWHSMLGRHRNRSVVVDGAACFEPEVSVFSALPDEPTEANWRTLAELHEPGATTSLFRVGIEPGPGWEVLTAFEGVQLVADPGSFATRCDPRAVELTAVDVDDMIALADATKPGPFRRRTIELGTYLGVRRDGELVAMAGERSKLSGHTEISAVCTAEAHRRQGLAARLVADLVGRIEARGETAFLHASVDNVGAIAVYEAMGFRRRALVDGAILRVPG